MASQTAITGDDPVDQRGTAHLLQQVANRAAGRDPVRGPVDPDSAVRRGKIRLQRRLDPKRAGPVRRRAGAQSTSPPCRLSARLTNASTIDCAIWPKTGPSNWAAIPLRIW